MRGNFRLTFVPFCLAPNLKRSPLSGLIGDSATMKIGQLVYKVIDSVVLDRSFSVTQFEAAALRAKP